MILCGMNHYVSQYDINVTLRIRPTKWQLDNRWLTCAFRAALELCYTRPEPDARCKGF